MLHKLEHARRSEIIQKRVQMKFIMLPSDSEPCFRQEDIEDLVP
jgi:hypothetical protein